MSLFAVALAVLASSCDLFSYQRPFDDAYYEDNFIASMGFDRFAATAGTDPLNPPTGQWDFAYRYDDWDGIEYMSLEAETAADYSTAGGAGYSGELPTGLSSTAPVYRLELRNMVSGGDFETDAGTWTLTGSSKANWMSIDGINHSSVQVDFAGGDTNAFSLVPVSGLMLPGGEYVADFKWKGTRPAIPSGSYFRMNDEPVNFLFNDVSGHATMQFTALDAGNTINSRTACQFIVDDLTVKKSGAKHQLRLLLRRSETKPDLEDFLYKFSFWVRPDPTVGAYTSPYHLDRLGIGMYPTAYSTVTQKSDDPYAYADGSGWVKMSTKVQNGNLQMKRGTKQPVLELIVDLDEALPGRILLAQPELRAYPDGY